MRTANVTTRAANPPSSQTITKGDKGRVHRGKRDVETGINLVDILVSVLFWFSVGFQHVVIFFRFVVYFSGHLGFQCSNPHSHSTSFFNFLSEMVKTCYRRATLSTRDYPPGCQLHSCERLRLGVASDFGSLLRVVFNAAALFVSSFVFLLS